VFTVLHGFADTVSLPLLRLFEYHSMYIDLNILTSIDFTSFVFEYWLSYHVIRIFALNDAVLLIFGFKSLLANHSIIFVLFIQSILFRVNKTLSQYCS